MSDINNEIRHVYIGLPQHLVNHVSWAPRETRTHPWSHIPGGSDVVVEYYNGCARGYDWIKKPSAYIQTFFDGQFLRVYARTYNDEEYSTVAFEEIWDATKSPVEMLWKALKKFDRPKRKQYVSSNIEEYEVWDYWFNEEDNQMYFGECPECNIPDRD